MCIFRECYELLDGLVLARRISKINESDNQQSTVCIDAENFFIFISSVNTIERNKTGL